MIQEFLNHLQLQRIEKFHPRDTFKSAMTITETMMDLFAQASGDRSRLHVDAEFAKGHGFAGRVAYGNILGMLVSTLVGMNLESPNVMIISQSIDFKQPVYIGDTVELTAEVSGTSEAVGVVEFDLDFRNQRREKVAKGKLQIKCL